jgi:hypothetical protein
VFSSSTHDPSMPDVVIRRLIGVIAIGIGIRYLWSG